MTDLEKNEVKSIVYEVLSKLNGTSKTSGTTDAFWRTVKIKELPVKEYLYFIKL